ncbi:MAG: tRNA uridine-5-carboxymethylaminomethyl(34) synthesis GTPase MnmE [Actinomycetota bacterium]
MAKRPANRTVNDDTIAAVATPVGEGGIGIVRLSGPRAIAIAERVFRPQGARRPAKTAGFQMAYGKVVEPASGDEIDEVVLSVMRAPRSYTREDVVEINCHGGPTPLYRTLETVLESGARLAEPGEFTRRAFLNGRIDLARAEAVIDLIRARTDRSSRLAVHQLAGGLSNTVRDITERARAYRAQLEAAVDFSDEDIATTPLREIRQGSEKLAKRVAKLIASSHDGQLLRDGVRLAIVGRPNVGKSSLLNALLNRERAIVTSIPGTTRDVIEETLSIDGAAFVLTDTAGIHESPDEVEAIGVSLSRRSLVEADIVLAVIDASAGLTDEDRTIIYSVGARPLIVVANKSDLLAKAGFSLCGENLPENIRCLVVSALNGEGIEELRSAILDTTFTGHLPATDDLMVANARHAEALKRALDSLKRSVTELKKGMSEEFASAELKDAIDALGEITGESVAPEVLDRIFAEFCIGK